MIELTFFTTDGCHLCEEANALLRQLQVQCPNDYQIELLDIAESDALIERYGIRIPVVKKNTSEDDLGWPFDYSDLIGYLGIQQ